MKYQDIDMNFLNANSTVVASVAAVCAAERGTVAAVAAAEGDTMSSEVRVG